MISRRLDPQKAERTLDLPKVSIEHHTKLTLP